MLQEECVQFCELGERGEEKDQRPEARERESEPKRKEEKEKKVNLWEMTFKHILHSRWSEERSINTSEQAYSGAFYLN